MTQMKWPSNIILSTHDAAIFRSINQKGIQAMLAKALSDSRSGHLEQERKEQVINNLSKELKDELTINHIKEPKKIKV
jgi:hypothetical protein